MLGLPRLWWLFELFLNLDGAAHLVPVNPDALGLGRLGEVPGTRERAPQLVRAHELKHDVATMQRAWALPGLYIARTIPTRSPISLHAPPAVSLPKLPIPVRPAADAADEDDSRLLLHKIKCDASARTHRFVMFLNSCC